MSETNYLSGHFLIAETELGDPNFVETVVLMVTHDEGGAFGLVVNRKSKLSLGEAAESYKDSPFGGMPLYIGGPVQQEYLFTLHSGLPEGRGSPSEKVVAPGIVFEPNFQSVEEFILASSQEIPPALRLFAGYSGWGAGQLEKELESHAWIVLPAVPELVFNPKPDEGWKDALRRKGGIYWVVAETGYKPSMN